MIVFVKRGENGPGRYAKKLTRLGLTYQNGSWSVRDPKNAGRIKRFCRRRGLTYVETPEKFVRSGSYRGVFFTHDKGYKGNGKVYHCAYCGRKLTRSQVTIDHIISVDAAGKTRTGKFRMSLHGVGNVNDVKNLAACCARCNDRKANRQGLWVIRGFMGKSIWFWRLRKLLLLAALAAAGYGCWMLYDKAGSASGAVQYLINFISEKWAALMEIIRNSLGR